MQNNSATPRSALHNIRSIFQNNEALLILCVQVAVLHIGQSLITPILPLYAQTFAVSITWVGFLLTGQALPRIFVNLPAGRLADKWGAHRLMMVAAFIVTVSAIGGGLAPNYWVLMLTRLLQGVGTGISQTAGFTYAATVSAPSTRARFISLYQGSFLLGNSVGPLVGGVAAQYFGYRMPFFAYAALAIVVGVWMVVRLPDPRLQGQRGPRRGARTAFAISLRQMLNHRGVLLASMIGFLSAYTRSASRNMAVPLRGNALGLTEGQIGLALSGVFLMTFIALYLVGSLADRFGRKAVIVPSWLFTAGALALIALAPSFGLYVAAAAAYGLAAGVGGPVPAAYVADAADEESQGMAIGVYRTFGDIGMVIGPLVMGWIIDQAGESVGLLTNAGIVVLVALAFWLFAPEPKVQEQAVSA